MPITDVRFHKGTDVMKVYATLPHTVFIESIPSPKEIRELLPVYVAELAIKKGLHSPELLPAVLTHEQLHHTLRKLRQSEGHMGIHHPAGYIAIFQSELPAYQRKLLTLKAARKQFQRLSK